MRDRSRCGRAGGSMERVATILIPGARPARRHRGSRDGVARSRRRPRHGLATGGRSARVAPGGTERCGDGALLLLLGHGALPCLQRHRRAGRRPGLCDLRWEREVHALQRRGNGAKCQRTGSPRYFKARRQAAERQVTRARLIYSATSGAVSLSLIASTVPAAAAEFEYKGFRQGMTEPMARQMAEQKRLPFRSMEQSSAKMKQYMIGSGESQDLAMFCEGRLMSYTFTHSADFQRFVNVVMEWRKIGYQITNAHPNSFFGYDGKAYTSIELALQRSGDAYLVRAALSSNETYGVTNYQIQFEDINSGRVCFTAHRTAGQIK